MAAILAGPTVVWAQTADSTVAGYAAPGATITVHNNATGLTRHSTAGGDGRFVIPGLPPGDYAIDAGPGTEQTVTLQVATTTNLDLKLAEITVTSSAVPVHQETLTSEIGQVVSVHDIDVLPQLTRNFLEFANQVPGVQFNVDSQGHTSLRGGAQLSSNVNVYIDGVSQKDFVFGGVTGQEGPQQSGDPGNPFPQLAIQEYKVVTSNYKAEFGDAASAIIITETRSGTNKFVGESFVTFTNQNLRASTPSELASGQPKSKSPSWEFGVAEGGPIIQDHLHFFLTFERKTLSEQNTVFPGGNADPAVVDPLLPPNMAAPYGPSNVVSQFGPTTNPFTENLGFGKLDFEPNESDRFELTAKIRDERQLQGAQGQTAASAATHYKNEDNRWMLRWTHNWQNILNELQVTTQNTSSNTNAAPSQQFDYFYYPTAGNVGLNDHLIDVNGPGPGVGFRYEQSGTGFQDDLTFTNFTDHTIKVGGHVQSIDLVAEAGTVDLNNAQYFAAVSSGNWTDPQTGLPAPAGVYANPYKVQFPVSFAGAGAPRVDTKDKQFGLYLQDDWTVNRNLTVNAGLRWDYEKVPLFDDYVTPAALVTALNSPGALHNCTDPQGNPIPVGTDACYGAATYKQLLNTSFPGNPATNIDDYISNGSNRKPQSEFQPRFGFAYDINADQQYVVFGGYGRSYDHNLFSTLSYETTKVGLYNNPQIYFPTPFTNDSFGPCQTAADVNPVNHCYAWNPTYLTAAGLATIPVSTSSHEVDMINNKIKAPHSDQFSIGFRTRLADWDAGVSFADIKSYDALIGHLGLRYADGSYYGSFGHPWNAFGSLGGYGALILWDNGGEDTNQQVTVAFTKAYTQASGWSASFALTYSNAYQNNVAGVNPYAGSPNAYLFDLPNPKDYPLLPSTAVPKLRFVSTGSYDLPWGLRASGKLEVATATYVDSIFGCGSATCNGIGGGALPYNAKIKNTLGYRDVDLSLAKTFNVWGDINGTVRVDALNVFNYKNFDPNAAIFTGNTATPYYNGTGPIVGYPRTFNLTANLRW